MVKLFKLPEDFKKMYEEEHRNPPHHPTRYEILEGLINSRGYEKIAELGCGEGFPALYLLENCPYITEYVAIDSCKAKHDFRIDEFHAFQNNRNFKGTFIGQSAFNAADLFPNYYFDLVYVDHLAHLDSAEEGEDDLLKWTPKVRKGGAICGHDYCPEHLEAPHYRIALTAVQRIFGGNIVLIPERQNYIWLKQL